MAKKHVVAILQQAPEFIVHVPGDGTIYIAQNPNHTSGFSGRSGDRSLFSDGEDDDEEGPVVASSSRVPASRPATTSSSSRHQSRPRHSDIGPSGSVYTSRDTKTSAVNWGPSVPTKPSMSAAKNGRRHSMPGTKLRLPTRQEMKQREMGESRGAVRPQGILEGMNIDTHVDLTIEEEEEEEGRQEDLDDNVNEGHGEAIYRNDESISGLFDSTSTTSTTDTTKRRGNNTEAHARTSPNSLLVRKQTVVPPSLTKDPQAAKENLLEGGESNRFFDEDGAIAEQEQAEQMDMVQEASPNDDEEAIVPPSTAPTISAEESRDGHTGSSSNGLLEELQPLGEIGHPDPTVNRRDILEEEAEAPQGSSTASNGSASHRAGHSKERYTSRDVEDEDGTIEIRPHSLPTPFMRSRRRSYANARSSISHSKRKNKSSALTPKNGDAAMDLDLDSNAVSEDEVASLLLTTSQLKRREKERDIPAPLLGPYQAARSGGTGLGLNSIDSSTRDSSAVDEESAEEAEAGSEAEGNKPTMTVLKSSIDSQLMNSEDDDEDDVVHVTSIAAGLAPAKPRKSKEERDLERQERKIRRASREERKKRKRKKPIPNYRYGELVEQSQLLEAYQERKDTIVLSGVNDIEEEEERRNDWRIFESFEPPKGRGRGRSDFNTVKFWPYNLPFPGRKRDEAIVAVAGGCSVSYLRSTMSTFMLFPHFLNCV